MLFPDPLPLAQQCVTKEELDCTQSCSINIIV